MISSFFDFERIVFRNLAIYVVLKLLDYNLHSKIYVKEGGWIEKINDLFIQHGQVSGHSK